VEGLDAGRCIAFTDSSHVVQAVLDGGAVGLVEQDQTSGRYDLGSFSLELGLAAMGRLDPVRLATPILEDL